MFVFSYNFFMTSDMEMESPGGLSCKEKSKEKLKNNPNLQSSTATNLNTRK